MHILQDEGTVGIEALQALRAWVRAPHHHLPAAKFAVAVFEYRANNSIVVTRRPRVLHWYSRFVHAMTILFSSGTNGWVNGFCEEHTQILNWLSDRA